MENSRFLLIGLFIIATMNVLNAQYVYSTIESNGKTIHNPNLKKEGSKWYYSDGVANPEWGKTTDPFYINADGELFDGNQEKIGWYEGNDFYLMTGWVVLDNQKTYYRHKELIYNPNEIAFRFCSDVRGWLVSKGDNKTYYLQLWDKIEEKRKTIITYDLVGLEMNKNTAVAIFELIKILAKDTSPCGFDEEDDRPALTAETPKTEKEKKYESANALLAKLKDLGYAHAPDLLPNPVETKNINFINKTNEDIFIAIAWYDDHDWQSKGWYNIKPGQESLIFSQTYKYDRIFWYAEDNQSGKGKIWDSRNEPNGERLPVRRPGPFEITNEPDTESFPTERAYFHELKITGNTIKQTITD